MWKEIKQHPGYYVNKEGHVARKLRSKDRTREYKQLKPFYSKKGGGGSVTIYDKNTGKRSYRKIAQLVLETFGRVRPSKTYWAVHLNKNVKDDSLANLDWREQGEVRIVSEESTGNYRALIGSTDIGSWPSELAARRAANKFKRTGFV